MAGRANSVSDLERAEHLNYADGKGVKRVTAYNDGVQVNVATEETLSSIDSKTTASILSTLNSTTTPLGAGATFTGQWEDCTAYSSFGVNIKTDQLGIAYFENSADGITVDRSFAHPLTDAVNYNLYFSVAPKSKYSRIRFVNTSSSAQTVFRIQTILAIPERGAVYLPIAETLNDNSTAKLTRSVITGKSSSGGGSYVNVKVNPSGSLAVSVGDSALPTGAAISSYQDPLSKYKDAGMDISGSPFYFGYLATDGSWYIKQLNTSSGSLYTRGSSNYDTAWSNRASLSYQNFNQLTW